MATGKRTRRVANYREREQAIRAWVKREIGVEPHIMEIGDPYGNTLDKDYDYIVVSPETYPMAEKINRLRAERGKKPIRVVRIDCVLAEDGKPISATRIVEGEIDAHGNLITKSED